MPSKIYRKIMDDERQAEHFEKSKKKLGMSKKLIVLILVILIVAAFFVLYLYGYISPFPFATLSLNKDKILFIQPIGCTESLCNTSVIRSLARQTDLEFELKDSIGLKQPIAMVSGINNTLSFVNLVSVKSFMNDICVYTSNQKACKAFSDSIQKSNTVNVMFFTSYSPLALSVNDILARNVIFAVQNKINSSSLTVLPRFVVLTNLNNSQAVLSTEVQEVGRQTCIRNEQPQLFWVYAGCLDGFLLTNKWTQTSWQTCAANVGVNATLLNDCLQNRGFGYVVNEANFAIQNKISVTPLIFINGDLYTSALNPDSMAKTICLYYNENAKPASC